MRDFIEEMQYHVDLTSQNETDIFHWAQNLPATSKLYLRAKAIYEPFLALILLVVLSPLMMLTALAVKLSSPGPVFFSQRRLGIGGKKFDILKFRTMRVDAEISGAQWASKNDPRVTKLGNILRLLHLDELPQLINIIKGDISFVGPRPERPEFYSQLQSSIPLFYLRTVIRPGVTGWAQIYAGYAASVEESGDKLAYDLYYIKNMGLRIDVISVILTFVHIFRKLILSEKSLSDNMSISGSQKNLSPFIAKTLALARRTLVVLLLTTLAISFGSFAFS